MLCCVDVACRDNSARAACVVFRHWSDTAGVAEYVTQVEGAKEYVPGQLFCRELPALLAVHGKVPPALEAVVVDGYVWLKDETARGLGEKTGGPRR